LATNHALGLVGLEPVTVDQLHPFIGHGSKAMIDAGLRFRDLTLDDNELQRLHRGFLDFYADNIAIGSRPFEGVPELLDELLRAGARLGVCTNKFEALTLELLKQLGLDQKFGAIAGRDTFDVFKPAPGHLTGTIERAGGVVERAVMVGDSEVDFATAMAAGVPSIGVTFGYTTRPVAELGADAIIEHYRDFPAALAEVLPRD
jgi:phosphoglycolate phosphatase